MKKKLLSLISAVLCLCMVLSACGGPANNDPSSSISESQGGDNTQDKNAYHRNHDRDNYSVSALYGCL